MSSLPTGTVTILLTDIEGSTRLLQELGPKWKAVVEDHLMLLRAAFKREGGEVIRTEGDSCFVVFTRATEAIAGAAAAQRALAGHVWPDGISILIRMGIHTGEPEVGGDDYVGIDVHRAARIAAAGHGGQILLSQTTLELTQNSLPPDVALRDLGLHLLKDLASPEHIYQLDVAGFSAEFPPLKSINNRPHNLPAQPTALIGREKEVAEACDLLRRDDVRLLTLTGPGGTGKTRLSLHLAALMLDAFEDGVFFVTLAPITDSNMVVATIAQILGIKERGGQPIGETLEEYLCAKTMLLVLDNFEQVIEAAPAVGELLSACPRLRVLATSRIALRLRGEQEFPVPSLALPSKGSTPSGGTLRQYAAVELFIQRALAVKPDFAVTNENAPALAEICARLDGMPLAIELAASRSRLLSPQAMLGRLENRLKLLTGGARDLPERQQTLRSTIAWSYDLLEENKKALFGRLSVFAGGCTLEAVEKVCNGADDLQMDVLDGVASLASHSLLRQEESKDFEPRFWMLETIREYAFESLNASGQQEAMQREHAEYFADFAEASSARMEAVGYYRENNDLEPRLILTRQLEAENDNLWAALIWAQKHQPLLVLRIVSTWYCASKSAYFSELGAMAERALESATEASSELASSVLGFAADHAAWRGDFARQQILTERRLAWVRQSEDVWNSEWHVAWTLHSLSINASNLRDHESAIAYAEESLACFRHLESDIGIGLSLNGLGSARARKGDNEAARICYEEARSVFAKIGDRDGEASALAQQADLARRVGNLVEARVRFEEVARIEAEIGDTRDHPWRRLQLAELEMLEGDVAGAGTHLRLALRAFQKTGYEKTGALYCLLAFGGLAALEGQWQRMAQLYGAEESQCDAFHLPIESDGRENYLHHVAAAKAALGDEAFANNWSQGRAMSWKLIIEYAQTHETNSEQGETFIAPVS